VMVSQNDAGELIIGDSHEYGPAHDPFIRSDINNLILEYLKTFARFEDERLIETWHGVYPKFTDGSTDIILNPADGVTIINGLGGAGMTLSFGLCEQVIGNK
ncbi:MAG: FAD-dependent oxidoreductase, partial [Chitinophagaceae bacterium]